MTIVQTCVALGVALGCLVPVAHSQEPSRPFPMIVTSVTPDSLELQPDRGALEQLAGLDAVRLLDVPLPGGQLIELELRRKPVDKQVVRLLVDGQPYERQTSTLLSVWTGVADAGHDDVFLAFSTSGSRGWIRSGEEVYHLTASPATRGAWQPGASRVIAGDFIAELPRNPRPPCGVTAPPDDRQVPPPPHYAGTAPLLECKVAVETDYHMYDAAFFDVEAVEDYVLALFAASSTIFETDVQVKLTVDSIGVNTSIVEQPHDWPTVADPPQGSNPIDTQQVFNVFTNKWGGGNIPNGVHLGHFLTPTTIGGGKAWLDKLCKPKGLAVSGSLADDFGLLEAVPNDVYSSPMIWPVVVVTHETGHNFNGKHTHEICITNEQGVDEPIDKCAPNGYYGPCQNEQVCQQGTIMSYCQLCPGGSSQNILPTFHQRNRDRIRAAAETACLPFVEPRSVPGDHATIQGAISALNDWDVIRVDPGTYFEDVDFKGKRITLQSVAGPKATTIQGSGAGSVVTFDQGELPDSVLEGFTITGGSAEQGGGIHVDEACPTIRGNVITGNAAVGGSFDPLDPLGGGGIYVKGQGIATPVPGVTIDGNVIADNVAEVWGGGVLMFDARETVLDGNVVARNVAHEGGGIMDHLGIFTDYTRNTVSGNESNGSVGGVWTLSGGSVHSNIFYANTVTVPSVGTDDLLLGGAADVGFNVIGVTTGVWPDSIQDAPHFQDPALLAAGGDVESALSLAHGSPAIDAGHPLLPADQDGSPADVGALPFDATVYDPWVDLGESLAGTGGVAPTLTGRGSTVAGSYVSIAMEDMLPGSTFGLFLGFSTTAVTFKGGVLVVADPVIITLPTGSGSLAVPVATEWVPLGTPLVFQVWIQDPGGPVGFSATNGLLLVEAL